MVFGSGWWVRGLVGTPILVGAISTSLVGQIPETFTNLDFFPADISRGELMSNMRDFSFALDVNCQFCHVGGDGVTLEGVDFASDGSPNKRKARFMLGMMRGLNSQLDSDMPDRRDPQVRLECKSCHGGLPRPTSLAFTLRHTIDEFGADSLNTVYDRLRQSAELGKYNFGEWEVTGLAEALFGEDRMDDAVAVFELNARYYPDSPSIQLNLGRLMERQGTPEQAIQYYERVLELVPGHRGATARLEALRGG